ncbi:AAA family ATPase [Streptomyces sp. NPDC017988]|uniref:AAA family ATPase n=1 Tax=Streptomyces sp. NPDC017988 TaxID=3365025 RepID=UPI0037939436
MTLVGLQTYDGLTEEDKKLSDKIFDVYRRNRPDLVLTFNPENILRPYHCGQEAVEMELGDEWKEGHHHEYWCSRWPDEIKDEIREILADHKAQRNPPFKDFWHDSDSLDNAKPLTPLLEGFYYRKTCNRIVGHSASMKSFVVLDQSAHMGWGEPWHGYRVQPEGIKVLIVVAEGAEGIRKRKLALEQHYGRKMENVYFLTRAIQINPDSADWHNLKTAIRDFAIDLVFFDTQARCTVGVEENSNREMGQVIKTLDSLIAETGVSVCLVHHSTGDQSTTGNTLKGRGANSVKAALQSEIFVKRDRRTNLVTVETDKSKDDAPSKVTLEPLVREVGGFTNYWGDPETSVVLVSPLPKVKGDGTNEPARGPEAVETLAARFNDQASDRPTVDNVMRTLSISRKRAQEVSRYLKAEAA